VKQPPTTFDLIIFDCDGVLIDSELLSLECLSELLCQSGYPIDIAGVFDRFLGRSFSVVQQQYQAALGRPLDATFSALFLEALKQRFKVELRPMAGVEEVIAGLKTRACVASSSSRDRLSFSLKIAQLDDTFAGRTYSSDAVARGKPAPDLFLHAAAAMQADAARTLVIEDSVNGVLAGKAAGMTVWGFIGGSHYAGRDGAAMLAAAGADRIVRRMSELPPI
jgi:HAD superfamily hydrolase (TIGR01509 family)